MWIHGFLSGGPASRSNTRYRPLSDSRAATTAPADPAPDTIKSNVSLPSRVLIRPPMFSMDVQEPPPCASTYSVGAKATPRGRLAAAAPTFLRPHKVTLLRAPYPKHSRMQ